MMLDVRLHIYIDLVLHFYCETVILLSTFLQSIDFPQFTLPSTIIAAFIVPRLAVYVLNVL